LGQFRSVADKEIPIANFGLEHQDVELLLLRDVSGSTGQIHEAILSSAMRAMNKLHFRDREGLLTLTVNAELAVAPTGDRMTLLRELTHIPRPEGGTEFDNNLAMASRNLKQAGAGCKMTSRGRGDI